jgi:hypothetical protein
LKSALWLFAETVSEFSHYDSQNSESLSIFTFSCWFSVVMKEMQVMQAIEQA